MRTSSLLLSIAASLVLLPETVLAQSAERISRESVEPTHRVSFNGIRLGDPLAGFASNSKGYRCAGNGSGRIAECFVLTKVENRCIKYPIERCGRFVVTSDETLSSTWRHFRGAQLQEARAKALFLDGRLVAIDLVLAHTDISELVDNLTKEYGTPAESIRRQSQFVRWSITSADRAVGIRVSNHPDDLSLSIHDKAGYDEYVAVYRQDAIKPDRVVGSPATVGSRDAR
jgi:hypothetical protein